MKKIKVSIIAISMVCLCMFGHNASASDSYDSSSKVSFTKVVLPDKCDNTTFASSKSGGKTTNRNYGKVKMTSYSSCSKVDCWMRTKSGGDWHYWTPYILNNVSDKKSHKIKYCDQKSAYYRKGVAAQLRGENADSRIAIFNDSKVSGEVWFN